MQFDDLAPLTPELVAYVLRAHTVELHELRTELHGEYLNQAQLMNSYIPRAEQERDRKLRREWPVIGASLIVAATAIVNCILLLSGGH